MRQAPDNGLVPSARAESPKGRGTVALSFVLRAWAETAMGPLRCWGPEVLF
jgi:hypothetical protein